MEKGRSTEDHRQTEQLELAKLAADGDASAREKLFDDIRPPLHRFVDLRLNGNLRSRVDASDVVQSTLAEADRRLEDYVEREPMPLRVWLLKLAAKHLGHVRIKHVGRQMRSVQREERLPDRSAVILAQAFVQQSTPSRIAMKRERDQQLAGMIGLLSEDDRDILLLRHVEELEYRDIAELLDVSSDAARQRYVQALLRLKQHCVRSGLDGDLP